VPLEFCPEFSDLSSEGTCVCVSLNFLEQFEIDFQQVAKLRVILIHGPACFFQEAEWLRGALQQWLDDEYCPEPANEEISRRCAQVYYYCLMEKQMDMGDILMQMVRDLETFSFKESFHGAFSSANAAIALITKRIGTLEGTDLQ
jgi:hypothetical protein